MISTLSSSEHLSPCLHRLLQHLSSQVNRNRCVLRFPNVQQTGNKEERTSFTLSSTGHLSPSISTLTMGCFKCSSRKNGWGHQQKSQHARSSPVDSDNHIPYSSTICYGTTFVQSKLDSSKPSGTLSNVITAKLATNMLATNASIDRKELIHLRDDVIPCMSGYWDVETGAEEIVKGATFKLVIQNDLRQPIRQVQIPEITRDYQRLPLLCFTTFYHFSSLLTCLMSLGSILPMLERLHSNAWSAQKAWTFSPT